LLPAGPLREPESRLDEADIVLVNGKRGDAESGFDLRLGDAQALDGSKRRSLSEFAHADVHAVAGIGNPQRFFDALREKGLSVIEHAFPDHHAFVPADLSFIVDVPVLMTEKDAIKCRKFAQADWYMVPVDLDLPDAVVHEILSSWEVRERFKLNQRVAAGQR
jgi:tetraacyldisaccharide 4'-kinase